MRLAFQDGRPYLTGQNVEPFMCMVTFGTPDSSILELITMIIVIMKNPKSSVSHKNSSLLQASGPIHVQELVQH